MEDLIMPCGDNCAYCPLHIAQTDEELQKVAELWYRIGMTSRVMPIDDIRCHGCESRTGCTFGIKECLKGRGITKCNRCAEFPCERINRIVSADEEEMKRCRDVCSDSEYELLCEAWFEKEANLRK